MISMISITTILRFTIYDSKNFKVQYNKHFKIKYKKLTHGVAENRFDVGVKAYQWDYKFSKYKMC